MTVKKTLCAFVAAASLGLAGCDTGPKFDKLKDLTGDSIPDLQYHVDGYYSPLLFIPNCAVGDFLLIGQKDGSFIRVEVFTTDGIKYFERDRQKYIFDGQFYKPLPKQK